jgi:hypothetical protein
MRGQPAGLARRAVAGYAGAGCVACTGCIVGLPKTGTTDVQWSCARSHSFRPCLQRAGQIYASPLLGDGKLYYTTREGKTFVVPVGPKFEVLAVNDLSDRSAFNATGAIADGRLFLRSDKFLYCIDER